MSRIRTIKPEFFTSEDIVSLSPLARLLYIALWCEADREGRMVWKPRTFKMRYLPADDCSAEELCDELLLAGVVVTYGDGLAYIPSFSRHQHVNPRERHSSLPDPDASTTRHPRVADASPRVDHAQLHGSDTQVGKEGKGREGEGKIGGVVSARATPEDRPKGALISEDAFRIASLVLDAMGLHKEHPMSAGAPFTIQTWLTGGWPEIAIIAGIQRSMASRKEPPTTLKYFERPIARAFAEMGAALPVEKPEGRNHGSTATRRGGSIVDAVQRRLADLDHREGEIDPPPGGHPLRLVQGS